MAFLRLAFHVAATLSCSAAFRYDIKAALQQFNANATMVSAGGLGHETSRDVNAPSSPGTGKWPMPLPTAWQDVMLGPLGTAALKYNRKDLSIDLIQKLKLPDHTKAKKYEGRSGQYWERGGALGKVQLFREIDHPDEVRAVKYLHVRNRDLTSLSIVQNEVKVMQHVRGLPGVMNLIAYAPSDFLDLAEHADPKVWIEMPYVSYDLEAMILSATSLHTKARIFKKLASGVENLHSKGVFHNNLNPPHILVDDNADVHIADFGSSCGPGVDIPCDRYSTMPYYAPEEVMRNIDLYLTEGGGWSFSITGDLSAAYTAKADVYALGLIVAQLAFKIRSICGLTIPGQCGLWGGETFSLDGLLKQQDRWQASALQGEAGAILRSILVNCLAADPAARWDASQAAARAEDWVAKLA